MPIFIEFIRKICTESEYYYFKSLADMLPCFPRKPNASVRIVFRGVCVINLISYHIVIGVVSRTKILVIFTVFFSDIVALLARSQVISHMSVTLR